MQTSVGVLVVSLILAAISLKSTAADHNDTAVSPTPHDNNLPAELTTTASSQNVHLVGYYPTPTTAVAVQDGYAYIGAGRRFMVLDVSNPAHPVLAGQTADLPDIIAGITIAGAYAYVAAGAGGVRIINIANPTAPVEVGAYTDPWTDPWLRATEVVVINQTAYVAGTIGATFTILNIANPAAPYRLGGHNNVDAYGVAVSGNYAYLSLGLGVGNAWLDIINVANPSAPFRVYTYNSPGKPRRVMINNNYAYVAEVQNCGGGFCTPGGGGLRILNIANPTAPYQVGHYNQTFDTANDVTVRDSYAYIAAWDDGLRIVDISVPSFIQDVGHYRAGSGYSQDLALSDYLAFVANDTVGLLILYFTPNFSLTTNHPNGAPGSVFTLSGTGFLPLQTAEISVNGRSIGSITTDENGVFSLMLSTDEADAGTYFITAATGPINKTVRLILDPTLPTRPPDGSGTTLEIPTGSAFTAFNYMPLVRR